uniref:Uncharacterized protein n=1 Tax=Meloidogyne floridensis TaxID=298350 RepID=A0A915NS10_9BILA
MIFDPRMAAAAALLMSSSPPNSDNNNNSFCDQLNVQNLLAQMTGGIQQQQPGMMLMFDKQFVPSNAFNLANGEDNEDLSP